ncbi:MAG: DUF748 domain-containing protein [Candidatus Omnitrophica bacterium]|jgi:hypothetical protein|nr:DUF748 domain-containing protein [Candidatus Omnitrophota bacterium]
MNINIRRKKITIILAALILLIAVVHLIVFIFLNVSGKGLLKNYIKTNFNAEAEISSVSFRFPFTVVIKGFKCSDVEFTKADISLGLFNPFSHSISLRRVYINDLNFKVKIEKDKVTLAPFFVKKTTQPEQATIPAEEAKTTELSQGFKQKAIYINIGKLLISNASAQILDLTKDKPVTFNLKNINIMLKRFAYPKFPKFYVEINASLEKEGIKTDNIITIKGWADYSHRNMDMKFNINNADYIMFSDYYPPFWKPDNLGLKEAKLSLDSKINSLNNDLVIEAILALDKIEFKEEMQNDSRVNSLKTMLAFFKGEDGKATLPIKLRTKMDSFQIDFASLQSEFKGKMKLDIGTIVINILDKAKGKITETSKDVKEATIDKAVDKTKEAAGTVKGTTVDTIKGVIGIVSGVINGKKEEKALEQPAQTTEQLTQQGQSSEPEAQVKTEENIPVPAPVAQLQPSTTVQEQNPDSGAQVNMQTQAPAQDVQANTENQNQVQPVQAQPAQ